MKVDYGSSQGLQKMHMIDTFIELNAKKGKDFKPLKLPGSNGDMSNLDGKEVPMTDEERRQIMEKIDKAILGRNTTFKFSVHDATNRVSVKVIDKDTNEVIREIPSEKVLDAVAKMWEMAGLFVDERR